MKLIQYNMTNADEIFALIGESKHQGTYGDKTLLVEMLCSSVHVHIGYWFIITNESFSVVNSEIGGKLNVLLQKENQK